MKTSTLYFMSLILLLTSGCEYDIQHQPKDILSTAGISKADSPGAPDFFVHDEFVSADIRIGPGATTGLEPLEPGLLAEEECRNPTKLPFRMADGLEAAGYGLNTNSDGIQNFGELAVDCGGAGAISCIDVPLEIHIESDVLLDPALYAGYFVHHIKGTLNGRNFEMLRPEPGQEGLTRDNVGLVVEYPTRHGGLHAPPVPYALTQLVPGQELGATAIAMQGVTGMHPYVFSAQEAVLASRYLREELDLDTVVIGGGSYGGAASLLAASAYPKYFDGVIAVAAPYNGRTFMAWSEMGALSAMASDFPVIDPLYYPALDGMTMAAAQAGLSIESLDITHIENAHIPAIIILGEADNVWLPGSRVAEDLQRMADAGMDWVDIRVIPEAQHGGVEMHDAILTSYEELYQRIDELRDVNFIKQGAGCSGPRQRDTTYDHVLRTAPQMQPHERITELWSEVSPLEAGNAAQSVLVHDSAVFSGSVQGYVLRREIKHGNAMVVWSTPVGRAVQALAVVDGFLVVGSKRGVAVLDATSGALLRETTGIGSVTDVVIADLIDDVPGLEIAARADMDMLHVESLADGTLLSSTTVGVGGAMVWSDFLGQNALLAPMQRGHVVAFDFIADEEEGWVPQARWISDYLAHDAAFVYPTVLQGEPVLLVGGNIPGSATTLLLIGSNGEVQQEIPVPIWSVKTVAPWLEGELLLAGTGGVLRVNLNTATHTPFAGGAGVVASIIPESTDDALALLWEHGFATPPTFRMFDRNGVLKHVEAGRTTSAAIDMYIDEDLEVAELSVMNRGWTIERFDLYSGDKLENVYWPKPEGAILAPRRLVRTGAVAEADSYEPFLSDGDMLTENIRVATRCGGWVATTSISQEQGHLVENGNAFQQTCASAEWGATLPTSIGYSIVSETIGSTLPEFGKQSGALRFIDISGFRSHAVMSTAGGQVALYNTSEAAQSGDLPVAAEEVADIGGTVTSLAVGTDLDTPMIALGSWLAGEDGGTLHLIRAATLEVRATIEAGPVLGVTMVDLNRDGIDEVLVGTQDGYLKAFDMQGEQVLEWSAGDLQLAENGAIFAHDDGEHILVAFAVAGGFRVLAIGDE